MGKGNELNRTVRKHIEDAAKKPSIIADRAGIRRGVFSRIINCKRPIYADKVPGICAALGVGVEELFSGL